MPRVERLRQFHNIIKASPVGWSTCACPFALTDLELLSSSGRNHSHPSLVSFFDGCKLLQPFSFARLCLLLGLVKHLARQSVLFHLLPQICSLHRVARAKELQRDRTIVVSYPAGKRSFYEQRSIVNVSCQFTGHVAWYVPNLLMLDILNLDRIAVVWVGWLACYDYVSKSCQHQSFMSHLSVASFTERSYQTSRTLNRFPQKVSGCKTKLLTPLPKRSPCSTEHQRS